MKKCDKMKFCCELFESYYHVEKGFIRTPAIKIVKLKPEHAVIKRHEDTYKRGVRGQLRFFITTKLYRQWDINEVMPIFIIYCPFCGRNLYKFYKDDAYANEIEGVTFDL